MRLLLTADTVGGVWTYAVELARALAPQATLAPHDIEIALATMGAPLTPEQRAEIHPLSHVTVFESPFKLEWMEEPWEDVARAGDWLLDVERCVRPDVVHLNGDFAHGALPWRAPALVVGHSCVLSWWEAVHGEAAPEGDWGRYKHTVTRGLRGAAAVAAPTAALGAALLRHYGPFRGDARIVPNARAAAQFPPGPKEPFILSAGRLWDAAKNVAALSAVAPGLPWPMYVAGEDRHPDGGRARHDNVGFLGRLAPTHLAGWLARAALYALPARYEPFGLSALEAGLAGCALVLGDIPSLREVWGEDAALFVPPDDTAALDAALRRLIADPALREEMAARARRRALEFTPDRMAAGYLEIYGELCAASAPLTPCPSLAAGRGAGVRGAEEP